jgi:DNA-binding CsgD family transcriptional regulator
VTLVERGLTNTEIARRLGLGRPTVARTLASAMAKLGVDRRAQLAALERV